MPATTPTAQSLSRISLERPLAGPCLAFDLPFEVARLRAEDTYLRTGHNGRTLAKFPDTRVVLTVLRAGSRMRTHETGERLAVQPVIGRIRLWLPYGGNEDLGSGGLAVLDREMSHEVEALDDCAFLLTVSWPGRQLQ